jgi:hypothetical protein
MTGLSATEVSIVRAHWGRRHHPDVIERLERLEKAIATATALRRG